MAGDVFKFCGLLRIYKNSNTVLGTVWPHCVNMCILHSICGFASMFFFFILTELPVTDGRVYFHWGRGEKLRAQGGYFYANSNQCIVVYNFDFCIYFYSTSISILKICLLQIFSYLALGILKWYGTFLIYNLLKVYT